MYMGKEGRSDPGEPSNSPEQKYAKEAAADTPEANPSHNSLDQIAQRLGVLELHITKLSGRLCLIEQDCVRDRPVPEQSMSAQRQLMTARNKREQPRNGLWDASWNITPELVSKANEFINHHKGHDITKPPWSQSQIMLLLECHEASFKEGIHRGSLRSMWQSTNHNFDQCTKQYRNAKKTGVVLTSEYVKIFAASVRAERSRQEFFFAQQFLRGVAQGKGPLLQGREVTSSRAYHLPLASEIFSDLKQGKREVSRFSAFNALRIYDSWHEAMEAARKNSTLCTPLPKGPIVHTILQHNPEAMRDGAEMEVRNNPA